MRMYKSTQQILVQFSLMNCGMLHRLRQFNLI